MKKFYTLMTSLLFGVAAVYAQDKVYLLGEFNNFGTGDLTEWELTTETTDDGFSASGTFFIPAGQFEVGFQIGDEYYGPSRRSGNDPINLDDGWYNSGIKTMEPQSQLFIYEDWEGGDVDIVVEIGSWNNVMFTDPNYVPSGPTYAYLVGPFNEDAEEDSAYELVCQENDGVYTGYVNIPAGQFSFNIYVPSEDSLFIPVDGEDTTVSFTDGVYYDDTDNYSGTTQQEIYWIYPDWAGGVVKVTLDADGGSLKIEEGGMPVPYISADFNDFEPNGDSKWALEPVDNGDGTYFYRGTFNVPAGDFEFNFVYNNYYVVPSDLSDYEIDDFDGWNIYDIDTDTSDYRWIITDWAGSEEAEFTVNFEEGTLTISAPDYGGETTKYLYVSGAFNSYNPAGNALYALAEEADNEGIFTGIIEIPEGNFSFNILNSEGSILIPEAKETVELTFIDDVYEGKFFSTTDTSLQESYWEYSDWTGGAAIVTVNFNNDTIEIVLDSESSVKNINVNNNEEVIFNLQGMKVNREKLNSGLYIINGKKVMIKK